MISEFAFNFLIKWYFKIVTNLSLCKCIYLHLFVNKADILWLPTTVSSILPPQTNLTNAEFREMDLGGKNTSMCLLERRKKCILKIDHLLLRILL